MSTSTHLSILKTIDDNYRRCWDILCELKEKPTPKVRQFQPLLCDAMLKLSREFKRINQKRDDLEDRAARLNRKWYTSRQESLREAKRVLRRAKGIGHSLGNSFAWFFYQNEPRLLELHSKHPLTDSLHADVGGAGEHAIVSAQPIVEGSFLLHHGTTSILRIGDVSLVDLHTFRVRGLGEIKTSRVANNELRVTLTCFADQPFESTAPVPSGRSHRLPMKMSRHRKNRLNKQIERLTSTLKARREDKFGRGAALQEDRCFPALAAALRQTRVGKCTVASIGDGLLAVVYRQRSCTLSSSLRRRIPDDFDARMGAAGEFASIVLPGSANNSIEISPFLYDADGDSIHVLGTMPLLWWRFDLEAIRRIIFQEVVVLTLFNPAHLIAKLQSKGFDVESSPEDGALRVSKRTALGEVTVQGMEYFKGLITQGLYTADMVVDILERVTTETISRSEETGQSGQTQIMFNHAMWPSGSSEA